MIEPLLISSPVLAALLAGFSSRYSALTRYTKNVQKGALEYTEELPPVSMILTCHNQGTQLEENLPLLLDQDYPNFQVIVVDDHSDDHSEDVLKEMSLKYKNLYHTFTPENSRYATHNKLALTIGIKAAQNEWLLFTQPDCKPNGSQWIKCMARNFTPTTDVVLGYANYEKESGLANQLISYDRFLENVKALGSVLHNKKPYRGDFCNMAFRKSVFLSNRGFEKNLFLKSGEDTLFINEVGTESNMRAELSAEATMQQENPFRFRSWRHDKEMDVETRRHTTSVNRMKDWLNGLHTLLLFCFYLLTYAEIAWGALHQDWLLLAINVLCLLLVFTLNVINVRRSAVCVPGRKFCISRFYLEPIRVLYSCYFWLRWKFSKKDKYLRK